MCSVTLNALIKAVIAFYGGVTAFLPSLHDLLASVLTTFSITIPDLN